METETLLTAPTHRATHRATRPGADGCPTDEWRQWATRVLSGDRRPEDYLPVPDEVRELVELDRAHCRERLGGVDASDEYMVGQLHLYVLSYYHGGQNIGVVKDDQRLIVVAVGLDQIGALCHTMPYELTRSVAFHAPDIIWVR